MNLLDFRSKEKRCVGRTLRLLQIGIYQSNVYTLRVIVIIVGCISEASYTKTQKSLIYNVNGA